MLELLETISGGVVLAGYLAAAVALPAAVVIAFVLLVATVLTVGIDSVLARLPLGVLAPLAVVGRVFRSLFTYGTGLAAFVALVGLATGALQSNANVLGFGLAKTIETLVAIQDLVAGWLTGKQLNDMLVETQGEGGLSSLRLLESVTAVHLHEVLGAGVTLLAFRWTFAAFLSALAGLYIVVEPARALRRRVAREIEEGTGIVPVTVARTIAAPIRVVRPPQEAGPAREAGAVAPARIAIVTLDPALAKELTQHVESLGFSAPVVARSIMEASAGEVLPSVLFVDGQNLQWIAAERVPPRIRARMVAVTQAGVFVPDTWKVDAYQLETGVEGLLDVMRRHTARRSSAAGA